MTSPTLQVWWYVNITLKSKADASTTTYNFSNRPILGETTGTYWPLLKNIGNLGVRMGNYLPEGTRAIITLDNSPSTFGYERKFSDLFERYTVVDQVVTIYGAETVVAELNPVSSFAQIWKAKIVGWSIDANRNDPELRIEIASETIPRRIVTKAIDSTQFPSATTANLGHHLPIVFGSDVEVRPIRVSADGGATPELAYCTTFADDFIVGGVQTYYARDGDGKYQAITNPASTSTKLGGIAAATPINSATVIKGESEISNLIVSLSGGILCSIDFYVYSVSGTHTGEDLVIDIVQKDKPFIGGSYPSDKKIGSAKAELDSIAGAGIYTITASFDKPVVLDAAESYHIVVKRVVAPGDTNMCFAKNTASSAATAFEKYVSSTTQPCGSRDWQSKSMQQMVFQLYGVRFDDSVTPSGSEINQEGLGHASFTASQRAAGTGQTNPDINDLDLVVVIDGLKDDGSGTITGSPNVLIEGAAHAVELLDKEWSGSAWTGGKFDFAEFGITNVQGNTTDKYYRLIAGATEGRTLLQDAYSHIMRDHGMRGTLYNGASKQLTLWAWGTAQSSVQTFSDENAKIINVEQKGTETILNRLTLFYSRIARTIDLVTGTAEGEFREYSKVLDWYNGLNSLVTLLTDQSEDLFGKRLIADPQFNWIQDTISMEHIAEFFLATYALPHWIVTLEVPFFGNTTIDMLDVITVVHPDLPAYFGTSSNADLPTYNNAECSMVNLGHYLKRAAAYRMQIEGKEMIFNIDGYPTLRLTCRVLDNYPKDPT